MNRESLYERVSVDELMGLTDAEIEHSLCTIYATREVDAVPAFIEPEETRYSLLDMTALVYGGAL